VDIQTKLVRVDRQRSSPGSFIDPEFVMHIVFAGSFVFQYQREVYSVRGHDMVLMPPNTLHALVDHSGIDMMVVHFNDRSLDLERESFPPVLSLSSAEFYPLQGLALLLERSWPGADAHLRAACDGMVGAMLGMYLHYGDSRRKSTEGREAFKNWEALKDAIQYARQRYADPELSISDLSGRVGLSYNYFCTLFHEYTNETPLHYLSRVRLEAAKELLFNERKNVTEAAAACGFKSIQQFSKVFRKLEGVSPTRWLKSQ